VGVRHALFPRLLDIWRPTSPVECCWLSVPRRCAGLHERLQSVPAPQRSRPAVSPPLAFRVRLLSPEFPAPAGASSPNPARTPLRMDVSGPLAQGRHRSFRRRSLALCDGSCLLPLQVTFCSHADDFLFEALHGSDVIAVSVVIAVVSGAFLADRSIRGDLIPFHLPVATPERFGG